MPPIEVSAKMTMLMIFNVLLLTKFHSLETVIKCLCILRCAECDHSASQMTMLVIEDFHILWIKYLHTSEKI